MNAAERLRRDRGNTWTCAGCGATSVSEGSHPIGWWAVSRRGHEPERHFDSFVCLLGWLAGRWHAVIDAGSVA